MRYLYILIVASLIFSCTEKAEESVSISIDLQGHRGARGLMPENTIPAFLKALDFSKVTTLELDLAVTKDKKLVVSHEPWFNHVICSDSLGELIAVNDKISIYQLTYEQIKNFDCGSLPNPRFPEQQKMQAVKPLFEDLIKEVNKKIDIQNRQKINYNIEIKSHPDLDSVFTPSPEEFSDLVVNFIKDKIPSDQYTIQSFDFRTLKYINKKYPKVKLVALIENEKGIEYNLTNLGFDPDVYSPYFETLSVESVDSLHQRNIEVIPWTVNDTTSMKQLIDWKIDGIITDYPNLAQKILENNE